MKTSGNPVTVADVQVQIELAEERLAGRVENTPLTRSNHYSDLLNGNVYLKKENLQRTGSFKLRGVFNKCLSLSEQQRARGLVAASTGNHGKALAYVGQQLGFRPIVFAPGNADANKLKAIETAGAELRIVGDDSVQAEAFARSYADSNNQTYISPYNDLEVVAGQGTIGSEILAQAESLGLPQVDAVIGSLGGGGMMSGIASAVVNRFPNCEFIGCSPKNSDVLISSMEAGRVLDLPSTPTLSEGTAGGVEGDAITFSICEQLIKKTVRTSETEIASELLAYCDHQPDLIEGAAAVSLAGLLLCKDFLANKNVVVILCGGNIDQQTLTDLRSGA